MCRTLVLLALLVAGLGGGPSDGAIATVGDRHELTSGRVLDPGVFARSGGLLLTTVVEPASGSGPAPRPLSGQSRWSDAPAIAPALDSAAGGAVFHAQRTEYRQYGSLLAIARAGLMSSPTTAPPPFLLI